MLWQMLTGKGISSFGYCYFIEQNLIAKTFSFVNAASVCVNGYTSNQGHICMFIVQWNLCTMDTLGPIICPDYQGVLIFHASLYKAPFDTIIISVWIMQVFCFQGSLY